MLHTFPFFSILKIIDLFFFSGLVFMRMCIFSVILNNKKRIWLSLYIFRRRLTLHVILSLFSHVVWSTLLSASWNLIVLNELLASASHWHILPRKVFKWSSGSRLSWAANAMSRLIRCLLRRSYDPSDTPTCLPSPAVFYDLLPNNRAEIAAEWNFWILNYKLLRKWKLLSRVTERRLFRRCCTDIPYPFSFVNVININFFLRRFRENVSA